MDQLEVLIQVAPYMAEEIRRQKMVLTARQTQYANQRAQALIDVLPFISKDEWPQHLLESLTIGSQWPVARERALAWRGLMKAWQQLPEMAARSLWQHGLRALAARPRTEFLQDLILLTPILGWLGGEQALQESIRAVDEAAAIWP